MSLRPVFPLVLTLTMSACQGSRRGFVIDTMQLGVTARATNVTQ